MREKADCQPNCVYSEAMLMWLAVETDVDSVFDEGNISSAQQILNQGAGDGLRGILGVVRQ